MKCKNCGMEIDNDSRFCSGCGARVEEVLSMREDALQAKKKLMDDLEIALPIYQKIASISEKIEVTNNKKNKKQRLLIKIFLWYIFLFCGAMLGGMISFSLVIATRNTSILELGIVIGMIAGAIVKILLKQKKDKDIDKQIKEYQVELRDFLNEYNCRELYCVPEKYRYFIAVNYIYECLRDGRASDLKEALNMYEEQMHRWKMEGYQQQMLVRSEQQLKVSQAILVSNFFR